MSGPSKDQYLQAAFRNKANKLELTNLQNIYPRRLCCISSATSRYDSTITESFNNNQLNVLPVLYIIGLDKETRVSTQL